MSRIPSDESDNSAALAVAARARREATILRARDALYRLDQTGTPTTFAAVAQAASVSRAWLYRDATMRAEIDRLRARRGPGPVLPPSAQRAPTESLHRRLETASEQITALREENRLLGDRLARQLGERRSPSRPGHS